MEKFELRNNIKIKSPQIHESAFIADGARVIGDVIMKSESSIWYNTVARADINQIVLGERSNIQDNSVLHLENDQGVIIGDDVTIGHNAIIHGCTIGDGALIGMGATILNGAQIGKNCLVGAGALITEGKSIPDGSMVLGMPGKVVKELDEDAINGLLKSAENYQANAVRFMKSLNVIEV